MFKSNDVFTAKVVDFIHKGKQLKSGLINRAIGYVETRAGGISLRVPESVAKNFLQSIRKDINKSAGSSLSLLEVCQMIQGYDSFDALLTVKFDKAGQRIELDEKSRQRALNSFSGRIKKAFAVAVGEPSKDMVLSNDQMLVILRETASFLNVVTVKYVPTVKVVKKAVDKVADKPKARKARRGKGIGTQVIERVTGKEVVASV